jgi:hypothetical protein
VLGFLNKHFKTNIIIHELTKDVSKLDFLNSLSNLKINHIVEKNSLDYYHRTKQLNTMLNIVSAQLTDMIAESSPLLLPPVWQMEKTLQLYNQRSCVRTWLIA